MLQYTSYHKAISMNEDTEMANFTVAYSTLGPQIQMSIHIDEKETLNSSVNIETLTQDLINFLIHISKADS